MNNIHENTVPKTRPNSNKQATEESTDTRSPNKSYRHNQKTTSVISDAGRSDDKNRVFDTFLEEGKSNAFTVNTPFTAIPGLPGLSKILSKIDKSTNQDLGFTFKISIEKTNNPKGHADLSVNLDYAGFGLMSSKFNVQYSPVSVKVESGTPSSEPHWGCSASVLSAPIGFVHERMGFKGTFSDCNSTRTFSTAAEFSYQKSSSFKPLSTATGGYFFGNTAKVKIPSEYMPTLERIAAASPNLEEWETIAEHISPSIPAIQIGRLIEQGIEIAENLVKSKNDQADSHIQTASNTENTNPLLKSHINHPTSHKVEFSDEKNSFYTVQQNDSLAKIGKKTGYAWPDIYALNKEKLQNNPDRIHPGQTLQMPPNSSDMELLKNPTVQARIAENLKKQQINQQTEPPHTHNVRHKETYIVQLDDTLEKIGIKTGHPWPEILSLNQKQLKNNPNKIYPGQELVISDGYQPEELINNPIVQARIKENMNQYQVLTSPEH